MGYYTIPKLAFPQFHINCEIFNFLVFVRVSHFQQPHFSLAFDFFVIFCTYSESKTFKEASPATALACAKHLCVNSHFNQ